MRYPEIEKKGSVEISCLASVQIIVAFLGKFAKTPYFVKLSSYPGINTTWNSRLVDLANFRFSDWKVLSKTKIEKWLCAFLMKSARLLNLVVGALCLASWCLSLYFLFVLLIFASFWIELCFKYAHVLGNFFRDLLLCFFFLFLLQQVFYSKSNKMGGG